MRAHCENALQIAEWLEAQKALSGMAYDDGRGITSVRLISPMGDKCDGFIPYVGHFMVPCAIIGNSTQWTLVVEDKFGNRATRDFVPGG